MNSQQMVFEGIVPGNCAPEQPHEESRESAENDFGNDQTLTLPLDLGQAA